MGHCSEGVTERYAKFQPDHLGAAVKATDAYCAKPSAVASVPILLGDRDKRQLRAIPKVKATVPRRAG
jgi:hypothetical protein